MHGTKIINDLASFSNVGHISLIYPKHIDDDLLSNIHRLDKMRVLSIRYKFHSITNDGLIDLVQHQPHLE